jgi:para-aminobenzoate synthetase component I
VPILAVPTETLRPEHLSTSGIYLLEDHLNPANTRAYTDPIGVVTSQGREVTFTLRNGVTHSNEADPFEWLSRFLKGNRHLTAVGYWGYDLRHHVERLPSRGHDDLWLPEMHVALFEPANAAQVGEGRLRPQPGTTLVETVRAGTRSPKAVPSITRDEFLQSVRKVKDYIAAGDCYQVNLSHRLSVDWPGTPWELYQRLRQASPAPYAAYLDCGGHQILSSSPELFLKIRDGIVETRPIKGTRPRGATPAEDAALAQELLRSEKDRAELVMIVDLERNDLGRVCEYGSVHVPELMCLESYANVHHLVSTVRGKLRPVLGPLDCLRAAFPGGSITGAPKIRAMEIIDELEPYRRGVYTGAIGWVDGRGNAEWSIAIRTMTLVNGRAHFHVGSGIVADSDPEAEYEETLTKASGMLKALGAAL